LGLRAERRNAWFSVRLVLCRTNSPESNRIMNAFKDLSACEENEYTIIRLSASRAAAWSHMQEWWPGLRTVRERSTALPIGQRSRKRVARCVSGERKSRRLTVEGSRRQMLKLPCHRNLAQPVLFPAALYPPIESPLCSLPANTHDEGILRCPRKDRLFKCPGSEGQKARL
jgi:hypothetical protein